jgi:hypothetical protein
MRLFNTKFTFYILIGIFFLALFLRFLYFPHDIYFAYDQARDAFVSQDLLRGDFKIVGPPSTFGISHGALFYYLYAPLYALSKGSPSLVSAFLRIYNAAGIFLVFLIAKILFNKRVGLIAALLFALSFEQTQYALFLGHPSLAVLSVLLFYLGIVLLIFRKDKRGFIISFVGLGLSVQFHFSLIFLFIALLSSTVIFRKSLPKVDIKTYLLSIAGFIVSVLTYLIAEVKFNMPTTKFFTSFIEKGIKQEAGNINLSNVSVIISRFVQDNLLNVNPITQFVTVFLVASSLYLVYKKETRKKFIFLLTWLAVSLLAYIRSSSSLSVYYYGIGGSVSLIIIASYLINKTFSKFKLAAFVIMFVIVVSNVYLIRKNNVFGTVMEINAHPRLLLSDEKAILDYIYDEARQEEFSVSAMTNPYKINTTWSYLFEWYGKGRYGYLPVWGGENAEGYLGNLKVVTARSDLPDKRFLIIEPAEGIPSELTTDFVREENYFTKVVEEKWFGEFLVQKRTPI